MRVGKHEATKEKLVTPRAPEILTIKTCPGEAGQPGCGKVHAYVRIERIYDRSDLINLTESAGEKATN